MKRKLVIWRRELKNLVPLTIDNYHIVEESNKPMNQMELFYLGCLALRELDKINVLLDEAFKRCQQDIDNNTDVCHNT